jgi:predicted dehydrogenase
MRGAVIGCGFFAQNHLKAWRQLEREGVELAAVCDKDRAKADAAAAGFRVPRVYDDSERLFDEERLDFVDIVTRMESHLELARLAAARKTRAIVQKPPAPGWADAVAIVETIEDAGAPLALHENFRFQTPMRKLKALLDSGAIGEPSWARIAFRTGFDVYKNQPYFHNEKRLVILDVGIHVLDLARFLLGEVERVSCETQRRNPNNAGEDTATMLLRHRSGTVSVLECTYESRLDPDPFPQTEVAIEGGRGSIRLAPGYRARVVRNGATEELDMSSPPLAWAEPPWHVVQESVLLAQCATISAWSQGHEAETNGRDNLRTFALAEAAYEAAATGKAVAPVERSRGAGP